MSTPTGDMTPMTNKELRAAITDLTKAVGALDITLKRDYPTREEIKKRRVQIVLAMVAAIIASYFLTVGTVSYCFLSGIPEDGASGFCNVFPGYEESFDNNRELRDQFIQMQQFIQENREKIEQLEEAK